MDEVRPSWRGWMHAAAFAVAIPAGVVLVLLADRAAARVAAAVYVATVLLGFGTSAAYHRLARSERAVLVMQRLDHSMIYLLIAGTYVPICLLVLPPAWGIPILVVLAAAAVAGIVMKLVSFHRTRHVSSALYPVMGWAVVVAMPVLIDRLTAVQFASILGGGLAYTIGFPVLITRRPNPWPRTFGYHEVWHSFTVVAAVLHFAAVSDVVAYVGRAALFDRIVVVDWSAASKPRRGADSIWMATVDAAGIRIENLSTRRIASGRLAALLDDDTPTLVGVDFSLGYPAGTAGACGLGRPAWRSMWEHLAAEVVDDGSNANNRFHVASDLNRRIGTSPGPFWGRPATITLDSLTTTKPPPPPERRVPRWRAVELVLRSQGWRPFDAWQLLGAGCVGSQSLVGIPVLERLRRGAAGRVHVWPFTTGLRTPPVGRGDVVVAEVWPSLVAHDGSAHSIRDAVQVEALAGHLVRLDERGELADLFAPAVGVDVVCSVVDEEGWILGVGPTGRV